MKPDSHSLHCRDVKRAHRDRAARMQTSEDPLQVSSANAPETDIP